MDGQKNAYLHVCLARFYILICYFFAYIYIYIAIYIYIKVHFFGYDICVYFIVVHVFYIVYIHLYDLYMFCLQLQYLCPSLASWLFFASGGNLQGPQSYLGSWSLRRSSQLSENSFPAFARHRHRNNRSHEKKKVV